MWSEPFRSSPFFEEPAQHRFHAEHREQVRGYVKPVNTLGRVASRDIGTPVFRRLHSFEGTALIAPIDIVCGRYGIGTIVKQSDQPARVPIGQRTKQDGVYDAENGGVRANSQCQCHDCNRREAGRSQKRASAVAEILGEMIQCSPTPYVSTDLPQQHGIAEIPARR